MTTNSATNRGKPPHTGREAIVPAVLESAAQLFAERGPAATSIRDIAERAGVNHGLVFRHFGAKENLVGGVLEYLSSAGADRDLNTLTVDDSQIRLHWTVLARCLLDGYPVGELQQQFPIMSQLVARARVHHPDDRAAALAAADAAALELGWQLFGGFLCAATGLTDLTEEELHRHADRSARAILEPTPEV